MYNSYCSACPEPKEYSKHSKKLDFDRTGELEMLNAETGEIYTVRSRSIGTEKICYSKR
jgi:hypothetical protein